MEDERVWDGYTRFCRIRAEAMAAGTCDLTDLGSSCPTIILPLTDFLRKTKMRWIPPMDARLAECLRTAVGGQAGRFDGGDPCPILALPKDSKDIGRVLAKMAELHDGGERYGGRNVFMYLIGELAHNVYDHSGSCNAFMMGQRRDDQQLVEISVFDDGITVGGSLRRAGIILEDDVMAIAMAMNGLSSKGEGRRGYGLRSNVKMCVQGLRGRILVVSGNGAIELGPHGTDHENTQDAYSLKENVYHLAGTLVSVRIPFQEKEVDLYEFA